MDDVRQLLKPSEVCRRLGVSRSRLYAAAADGRIPSLRLGAGDGPVRFDPEEIERWLVAPRSGWRLTDTSADAPARRPPDYHRSGAERTGTARADLRIRGFWLMARGSVLSRTGRDGVVTYSIKYRLPDGTQVKGAIGPSRREAERALTKALAAVDRGEATRATRETFASYAERWLAEHGPRVERATAVDYGNTLQNHLIPYFGEMRLSAIAPEHVRAYVAAKAAGTAPVREQPAGRSGRIKRKLAVKTFNNQVTRSP